MGQSLGGGSNRPSKGHRPSSGKRPATSNSSSGNRPSSSHISGANRPTGRNSSSSGRPVVNSGRPGTKSGRPTNATGRPGTKPTRPANSSSRSGSKPARPTNSSGRPGTRPVKPVSSSDRTNTTHNRQVSASSEYSSSARRKAPAPRRPAPGKRPVSNNKQNQVKRPMPNRRPASVITSKPLLIFTGCILLVMLIAIIKMFFTPVNKPSVPAYASATKDSYSQVEREKYKGEVFTDNNFYVDHGVLYIGEGDAINEGLKYFYEKTGVCLFYEFYSDFNTITDNPEEFAKKRYAELFSDQGHLLIIFNENSGGDKKWSITTVSGKDISSTVDDEAVRIISDYLDNYFASADLSAVNYGEFFGKTAVDAADRIMYHKLSFGERNKSAIIILIICISVLVIIYILNNMMKTKIKPKATKQ